MEGGVGMRLEAEFFSPYNMGMMENLKNHELVFYSSEFLLVSSVFLPLEKFPMLIIFLV